MLGITEVSDDQVIVIRPAVKFSRERGVYLAPVTWAAQTTMFCITPQRLQQEFTQAIAAGSDIAAVFDLETYRSLKGKGVYLDYYHYAPPEPGEKNRRNYANGVGVCYVTEAGEHYYTRADFIRLCNGEEAVACRLFGLCDWQAPETLLDEELRDHCLQLPVLTFDPSSHMTWLTFHPEESEPGVEKRALLQQAGWREVLSRRWTYQGQAAVPQGIAYVSEEAPRTVNIEPTSDGYQAMKKLFQESVQTYQEQLQHLETLVTCIQSHPFGEATRSVHTLLEEMVATKRATIEDAAQDLAETIAQLERCGY